MKLNKIAAAVMALAIATVAYAASWSGVLSGTNTVDFCEFYANDGSTIHYDVSGWGPGTNKLTLKVQVKKSGLGWRTIERKTLYMPSDSLSDSFTVPNETSSSSEFCRYRLSRKALTKRIYWDVSH